MLDIARRKKLFGAILAIAFVVFAAVDGVHGVFVAADRVGDFSSNNGFHYYWEQPHRLLYVAGIGIAGGLVWLALSSLPPRWQRRIKLVVLGSSASLVMLGGGYIAFWIYNLPRHLGPAFASAIPQHLLWGLAFGITLTAGSLWLWFFEVLRSRDPAGQQQAEATGQP